MSIGDGQSLRNQFALHSSRDITEVDVKKISTVGSAQINLEEQKEEQSENQDPNTAAKTKL